MRVRRAGVVALCYCAMVQTAAAAHPELLRDAGVMHDFAMLIWPSTCQNALGSLLVLPSSEQTRGTQVNVGAGHACLIGRKSHECVGMRHSALAPHSGPWL